MLTSAIAVQFFSHKIPASCSFVLFLAARCLSNHFSPTMAWLFAGSPPGPRECFEVTTSFDEDRAPMKMIQPFDFKVKVYGAEVRASRDDHWATV